MRFLRLPILVIGLIACGMPAQAVMGQGPAIAIVVSERSAIRSLSQEDIAAAFLGMSVQNLAPIDSDDVSLREAFYQQLLGRSRNQMRAYWSRMVFTGQGRPPPVLNSDELGRVSNVNWLGYVRSDQKPAKTRVLLVLP